MLLMMTCVMQPLSALADGIKEVRRSYVGVWAGERMLCSRPTQSLHVYGPARTRHPAIFQDTVGYACKVRKVEGRSPAWTLRLNCTSFGLESRSETLRATQRLTLLGGGKLLRMTMHHAQSGEELWADDLHWCRPFRTQPALTRIP